MIQSKQKNKNNLVLYRRRMGFSQKTVSRLLGHKDATLLCSYERGRILPPLVAALGLGIVLRVPVEFLFPGLYDDLKGRIRQQEELRQSARQARDQSDH
jgi:DNA-binding XRE family transcriptional regulator